MVGRLGEVDNLRGLVLGCRGVLYCLHDGLLVAGSDHRPGSEHCLPHGHCVGLVEDELRLALWTGWHEFRPYRFTTVKALVLDQIYCYGPASSEVEL